MTKRQPRYTKDELTRLGTEIYENKIRPIVEAANHGRLLAIDIETGDFEIGDETLKVCQPLIDRNPDAQIWCLRIGHRAVGRMGFQLLSS